MTSDTPAPASDHAAPTTAASSMPAPEAEAATPATPIVERRPPLIRMSPLAGSLIAIIVALYVAARLWPETGGALLDRMTLYSRDVLPPAPEPGRAIQGLFGSFFVHRDLTHLVFNVAMLAALGRGVEVYGGRLALVMVLLVGHVVGVVAQFAWTYAVEGGGMTALMGASAGTTALMGAFMGAQSHQGARRWGVLALIAIGMVAVDLALGIGFLPDNVRIATGAHVGGLVAGAVMGAWRPWRRIRLRPHFA